ncbi:MAG: hypothetical protein R2828_34970 [Saprospiraceae bacterium]
MLTSLNLFAQTDKNAYDVYSTIIQEEFKLRNDTVDNLVFINRATSGKQISETIQMAVESVEAIQSGQLIILSFADNINEVLRQSPEIGQLIHELKADNKDNELKKEFYLDCEYNLITRKKFEGLLKNNGLSKLKDKDSRFFGAFEFSNVAFEGDYAAVYCGLYIGRLNAVGTIVILKKEGTKWRIISRPEFWVS